MVAFVSGLKTSYGMLIFGGTPHMQDVQVEAVTAAADHNAYGIRIDSAGSQTSPVRVENVRATGRNGSFTGFYYDCP